MSSHETISDLFEGVLTTEELTQLRSDIQFCRVSWVLILESSDDPETK